MKIRLHPGARWLFRLRFIFIVIIISIFITAFLASWIVGGTRLEEIGIGSVFLYWLVILIFLMLIGEIWVRLYYSSWYYEFTEDALKTERGVIWRKYSSVPYERIQNVDIHRGIIARILGFSSINIQTAGYSMPARGYGGHTEGYLPAIEMNNAEKIREFVIKKIKGKKQGL